MKILSYSYTLDAAQTFRELNKFGDMDSVMQRIRIANDVHPEAQASTLLHEAIEAVNSHLNLGLKEEQICGLEVGLYRTLVENGVSLEPLLRGLNLHNKTGNG